MRAVKISIQPEWCEKIANGKKTIEVRKTRPKLETPFKCYIYMTKNGNKPIKVIENDKGVACLEIDYKMAGKVIGEFVCNKIVGTCGWRLRGNTGFCAKRTEEETMFPNMSCLTIDEITEYAGGDREIYGWYISDLKIYNTPMELGEFWAYNDELHKCYDADAGEGFCCYDGTNEHGESLTDCGNSYSNILNCYHCWNKWSGWCHRLVRPPQSWCYVEDIT